MGFNHYGDLVSLHWQTKIIILNFTVAYLPAKLVCDEQTKDKIKVQAVYIV